METKTIKNSPNGQHAASVVMEDGKQFVILDGKRHCDYGGYIVENSLTFSPDSTHLAYVIADHIGRQAVVWDGKRQKKYGYINSHTLVFSPDSCHLAYEVDKRSSFTEKNKHFYIIDGRKCRSYDHVSQPVFTPDSRLFAYVAGAEGPVIMSVIGPARPLRCFCLVVIKLRHGRLRFLSMGRFEKRFEIDGVGSFFPEASADSKRLMVVDQRFSGHTSLTVNLDDEL